MKNKKMATKKLDKSKNIIRFRKRAILAMTFLAGMGLFFAAAPAFADSEPPKEVLTEMVKATELLVSVTLQAAADLNGDGSETTEEPIDKEESQPDSIELPPNAEEEDDSEDESMNQYFIQVCKDSGEWEECDEYDKEERTVSYKGLLLGDITFPEVIGTEERSMIRIEINEQDIKKSVEENLPFFGNQEDVLSFAPATVTTPINGLVCSYELEEGKVRVEEEGEKFCLVSDGVLLESDFAVVHAKACDANGEVYAQTKFFIPITAPKVTSLSFDSGVIETKEAFFVPSKEPRLVLSYIGQGISSATVSCAGEAKVSESFIIISFNDLPEGEQTIEVCGQKLSFWVDTTAPTVRITQNPIPPKGTNGIADFYDEPVYFDIEVFDLNLDMDESKCTFHRNGKEEQLTFLQKGTEGEDRFTWTASFMLDDKAESPDKKGDELSELSGFIVDDARNGALEIINQTNSSFTVDQGKIKFDNDAKILCIDKNAPLIFVDAPKPENSTNSIQNQFYYRTEQSITVTVTEANLDLDRSEVFYVLERDGTIEEKKIPFRTLCASAKGAVYTLKLPITDGQKVSEFCVAAKDFGGKTTQNRLGESVQYIVDTTAPHVNVLYDNQDVRNDRFFKEIRTATITLFDLNIEPEESWIKTEGRIGKWSRSGKTWTSIVTFDMDGAYHLEIEAVDKAGNAADIDYTNHGTNATPREFIIDKTKPIIRIAFDNNDVLHQKYYNKDRTAQITVEEKHFSSAEAEILLRAIIDNEVISAPEIKGGWTDNGDEHTASIPFTKEGEYSGTIRSTDLAGNEAEVQRIEAFIIDKTPPVARLFGVKNKEAKNGSATLTLCFSDRNFDENGCHFTWTRTDRLMQTKDLLNGYFPERQEKIFENHQKGIELVFQNPDPAKPENDGIYRLTAVIADLAGNTAVLTDEAGKDFPEGIRYSLNRFGSTYDVPKQSHLATQSLLDTYYTDKAPSLCVRETNPNALKNQWISLAVNGSVRTLTEGKDYFVTKEKQKEFEWKQYVYRIPETAFLNDFGEPIQGEYQVAFYSEDEAGNLNTNRSDLQNNSLEFAFVLDNEAPSGYLVVAGLEAKSDSVKAEETSVNFYWEDNIGVKEAELFLNGTKVQTVQGEKTVAGTAQITVKERNEQQTVTAVITDLAGNQKKLEEVHFYLNSNGFRHFFRNPPRFLGWSVPVLAGVILLKIVFTVKRKGKTKASRTGRA